MQTSFTPDQLSNPDIQLADKVLRSCVHCGFCNATCPTFLVQGDELDSPRGRIYLIKDLLEGDKPATAKVTQHIDRCLSCLSCMTTCPASVNYMRLVDIGRIRIEQTFQRPWAERLLRSLLATVIPNPGLFRLALIAARIARPFKTLMPGRLKTLIALAPTSLPRRSPVDQPQTFPAVGTRQKRVVLMNGCAQQVLRPEINAATIRLLTRHGCEVIIADGAGCCGALVHHMGREEQSLQAAKNNIAAWESVARQPGGLDAVIINASGCGTTVKDYGFMLRKQPDWAERAERVARMTQDVTEFVADLTLLPQQNLDHWSSRPPPAVTYHSACSMQHGQKLTTGPQALLSDVGFSVREPAEGHICCGSAGTYNLLQPEISQQLQQRKISHLTATEPDVIASGNIGCIEQISTGLEKWALTRGGRDNAHATAVVHTVELLDWATGGPIPVALRNHSEGRGSRHPPKKT